MKKQYIFFLMIIAILFLIYKIGTETYSEYKKQSNTQYLRSLIVKKTGEIKDKRLTIEYQASKAFRKKILKEQQSRKDPKEKVVYFTSEQKYNNYTRSVEDATRPVEKQTQQKIDTQEMSIYEKWMYLLFNSKS